MPLLRLGSSVFLSVLLLGLASMAQAQKDISPNDPVFLRWPELRTAYFKTAETKVATHKYVAMPMPKECAFFYSAVYSGSQMSDRDAREKSVRDCNQRLAELGPLHENYSIPCSCRPVIGRDKYRLDYAEMPSQVYAPFAMFYRDRQGMTARLYGYVEIGIPPQSGVAQIPMTVFNSNGQAVCNGSINANSGLDGSYSLSCLRGTVVTNGRIEAQRRNAPIAHSVARGTTPQGQPTVLVIGLPSQIAYDQYGRI